MVVTGVNSVTKLSSRKMTTKLVGPLSLQCFSPSPSPQATPLPHPRKNICFLAEKNRVSLCLQNKNRSPQRLNGSSSQTCAFILPLCPPPPLLIISQLSIVPLLTLLDATGPSPLPLKTKCSPPHKIKSFDPSQQVINNDFFLNETDFPR